MNKNKKINKLISMSLVTCTLFTSFMSCTNAKKVDNRNTDSRMKRCLKYATFAGGTALAVGAGYVLRDLQYRKAENNKLFEYLKTFCDDDNMLESEMVKDYIKKFIRTRNRNEELNFFTDRKAKEVVVIKDFNSFRTAEKARMIDYVNKGKTLVVLGDIISIDPDNDHSIRNLLFLMELQRLYPEKVIILKGYNEIRGFSMEYGLTDSLYSSMDQLSLRKYLGEIRGFLLDLPVVCKVQVKSGVFGEPKNYLFDYSGISRSLSKKLIEGNFNEISDDDAIFDKTDLNTKEYKKFLRNFNCHACYTNRIKSISSEGVSFF